MSTETSVQTPVTAAPGGLTDLVEKYGLPQDMPAADWLLYLKLERPRKTICCLSWRTRVMKRTFDLVVSSTMFVLLLPVMALVALAVWVTSPGPIIFRQVRTGLNLRGTRTDRRFPKEPDPLPVGFDRRDPEADRRQDTAFGKPFVLYKFRTMRVDAEKHGAQFATKGDSRVTSIGRFLRQTRLDELPQLWNVMRGQMSLVGPRPERPEFIQRLSDEIPDYLQRLGLQPGLTGVAQVINGYDNDIQSFRRKVALDLLYLQNCCLWNDLKIMFRTVGVVLTGKGAL
ncbi:MAG: sugar transferase [Planctomycetales bacterium]|nr:sugar transferase [Planctomycetales bacterium]